MDNNNSLKFDHSPYHNLLLKDRKTVELTGVKNVESFDTQEFLIETALGFLNIIGNELSLVKLDTTNGEVIIKGSIDSLAYVNNKKVIQPRENMFNKLFK